MPTWWTIALKDLRILGRDRVALFWVLGFPLLFAGFFGSIMRAGLEDDTAPIPVIVVADAGNTRADGLATGLGAAGLAVTRAPMATAEQAVLTGDAVAFVSLSPEQGGPVQVGLDPTRKAEGAMLEGLILRALSAEFASFDKRPPEIATRGVASGQNGPRSGYELVFPAMILWALLGCAATFAIALVSERSSGTLQRLWAAPIARSSVLAGKAGACMIACLLASGLLSAVGVALLDVHIDAPGKYLAGLLAATICFAGLMMVLSVLGKTDQAVAGAGWSTLIVLAMLGGAMVPLTLMPEWLLTLSDLSPVKWGIRALEGAIWRGDPWRDLVPPLTALCALGVAMFALGTSVLSVRET